MTFIIYRYAENTMYWAEVSMICKSFVQFVQQFVFCIQILAVTW